MNRLCPKCGEVCPAFKRALAEGPEAARAYLEQVGQWRAEDSIRLRRRWYGSRAGPGVARAGASHLGAISGAKVRGI